MPLLRVVRARITGFLFAQFEGSAPTCDYHSLNARSTKRNPTSCLMDRHDAASPITCYLPSHTKTYTAQSLAHSKLQFTLNFLLKAILSMPCQNARNFGSALLTCFSTTVTVDRSFLSFSEMASREPSICVGVCGDVEAVSTVMSVSQYLHKMAVGWMLRRGGNADQQYYVEDSRQRLKHGGRVRKRFRWSRECDPW